MLCVKTRIINQINKANYAIVWSHGEMFVCFIYLVYLHRC